MTKLLSWILGAALLTGSALAQDKKEADAEKKKDTAPPKEAPVKEVAVIKTSAGEMVAEFWSDVAPKTVENFKKLAKQGFFDGTAFHRIMPGFMIQGGDPNTKDVTKEALYGQGDPGYKIDAEFSDRKHTKGVLSMARSGDPREQFGNMPSPQFANSAGSQFFIMLGDAPHLDKRYTAFGKLIKGEDVLDKIAQTPIVPNSRGERSKPAQRVEVESIKIVPADSIK